MNSTLNKIKLELEKSLKPEYKKLWVEKGGKGMLMITVFHQKCFEYPNGVKVGYKQLFVPIKNLKEYKNYSQPELMVKEKKMFADQVNYIKNTALNDYVQ